MALLRSLLLRGSESRWLAHQVHHRAFARRAVRRFMPGEELDAALDAAARQAEQHIGTTLTHLGENVAAIAQAEKVAEHYMEAIGRAAERSLPCEFSVKLTHLGFDISQDTCTSLLGTIAARAREIGSYTWIDMEGSAYTEGTLDLFRRVRQKEERLGLCLQAYLRRTARDLETVLPLEPAIRLVKGAYAEPPSIAFRTKREVNESFYLLATRMLEEKAKGRVVRAVFGTHDLRLIGRLVARASGAGLPRDAYEIHMLYGIRTDDQQRLAAAGHAVRVLISYGDAWFPWYMRRLAERPANLWFALRSLLT